MLLHALPWQVFSAMGPRSRQGRQKPKCRRLLGLLRALSKAGSVLKRADSLVASSARRAVNPGVSFCEEARVYQTRGRVSSPDPMGTWCVGPRPQAESVVTQTHRSKCGYTPLWMYFCECRCHNLSSLPPELPRRMWSRAQPGRSPR